MCECANTCSSKSRCIAAMYSYNGGPSGYSCFLCDGSITGYAFGTGTIFFKNPNDIPPCSGC